MRFRREITSGAGLLMLSAGLLIAGTAPQPWPFVLLYVGASLLAYALTGPEQATWQKATDRSLDSPQRRNNMAVAASMGRSLIAIAITLAALAGLIEVIVGSGGGVVLWAAGMLLASGAGSRWVATRELQGAERA
ncbi:hypothetical protein [Pseudactinotalea sp.]|uniref:hypothetical protein n=1 Tax=Pseudactinotalea sp. TaxID=1926260 RepID=UPI003B3A1BED